MGAGWGLVTAHLSDDETVAKMGHPAYGEGVELKESGCGGSIGRKWPSG